MKIYADTPHRPVPEWCWHRRWTTKYDSAYGLLMKFAFLNALSARDLARLFVTRKRGMRTSLMRSLQFDLRDRESFDHDAMATAFGTDLATIQGAFLDQRFVNPLESDSHLKWCEQCLAWGLHLPSFQMRVVTRCPLHTVALRDRCFTCDRSIPYVFHSQLFEKPFCCPHCQADMAPHVKLARARLPALRQEQAVLIERMNRYARAYGDIVKRELPIPLSTAQSSSLHLPGAGDGQLGAYIHFLGQVVAQLAESDGQGCLPLAIVTTSRCGCDADRSADAPAGVREPDGLFHGPFGSEQEMLVAMDVYRALRRRIWRGLGRHRQCVRLACQHLWWETRGSTTKGFCQTAAAYIRWRMLWEGCGTPRYLQARRPLMYYGILGWLHSRPAPYPDGWTIGRKAWLLAHIFASVIMASYDAIERSLLKNPEAISWEASMSSPLATTHWALSDPKSVEPTTLFVPARRLASVLGPANISTRAHLDWHTTQLRQIAR